MWLSIRSSALKFRFIPHGFLLNRTQMKISFLQYKRKSRPTIWPAFHMVIESTSEYSSSRKFAPQRIYPFSSWTSMSFSLSWRKNGLCLDRLSEWSLREFRNVFRSFCVLLLLCLFFFLSVRCNLYRSPTRHICDVRRIRCLSVLRRLFGRCFFPHRKRVGRQQVYTSYVYTPRYEGVDHFDEVGRENP